MHYQLALTLIPGVGPILAKKLIANFGNAATVFCSPLPNDLKIPATGQRLAEAIAQPQYLKQAKAELEFIEKYQIKHCSYFDANYPERLKQCEDAPLLLFQKGPVNLNSKRVVAVVGTRSATPYGIAKCEEIISDLIRNQVVIVSGLAYGIDITAHRMAIAEGGITVGVVAHGLNKIYPALHRQSAKEMLEHGGIVTELTSQAKTSSGSFPQRNRIVAGLSDLVLVIESASSGGSLITAQIANSYNREVAAVPGRVGDYYSAGCNHLIQTQQAHLVQTAADILKLMNWEEAPGKPTIMAAMNPLPKPMLNPKQMQIYERLVASEALDFNQLCVRCQIPAFELSALLLELELLQVVKLLPGSVYRLAQ